MTYAITQWIKGKLLDRWVDRLKKYIDRLETANSTEGKIKAARKLLKTVRERK
jgi:uncharacterized protein HemY